MQVQIIIDVAPGESYVTDILNEVLGPPLDELKAAEIITDWRYADA